MWNEFYSAGEKHVSKVNLRAQFEGYLIAHILGYIYIPFRNNDFDDFSYLRTPDSMVHCMKNV